MSLVRIIDTANSLDQRGIDSKPTITIRNIVFDLAGIQTGRPNDNFEFCAVTALRSQFTDYAVTGRKTLLPDNITVDGMTAINVQPTQNAVMCGVKLPADLYQNTVGSRNKRAATGRTPGSHCATCTALSTIRPSSWPQPRPSIFREDAANWTADYLNSDYSWIPPDSPWIIASRQLSILLAQKLLSIFMAASWRGSTPTAMATAAGSPVLILS
ncbi:hypothetical protein I4522_022515 [Klebsiella pneumoniae]